MKCVLKVKYIKNKKENGIEIDWNFIRKEYKKLGCPEKYPDLLRGVKLDIIGYLINVSERSRGKTTCILLYGLLLYKYYGIQLQYIRQKKSDVERKAIKDLYQTVIQFGYLQKIFGDKVNNIEYYGKRWYLVKVDDKGVVIYRDNEHCCYCCGLDESYDMKSVYNAPMGDLIFYDEFISNMYGYNDFVNFCDICKTIIRDRISPIIVMSANTININSPWFDEFGIRKEIELMNDGESKYIESELGTHIYYNVLSSDKSEQRENVNRKFWGFRNTKLQSITGKGLWASETFPHIPKQDENLHIIQDFLIIEYAEKYAKLMLVNDSKVGLCVYVHPFKKVREDNIIMTLKDIDSKNKIYGIGKNSFCDLYWKLYSANRWYYSSNSVGAFVKSYLALCKSTKINRIL